MSSIDDIKKEYFYKFDNFPKEKPSAISYMNFAMFDIHVSRYKLQEKMAIINKTIEEGKIKDNKILEQCTKQLNNMKATIDDIYKKKKRRYKYEF